MTKFEELRAAYEATTGGEWRTSQGCIYKGKTNISIAQCYVTTTNLNNDEVKNANFIALAHNNMPALLEAVEFVAQVSRYLKDGEEGEDGEVFVMENDDAVDTLHLTISDARRILEKLK